MVLSSSTRARDRQDHLPHPVVLAVGALTLVLLLGACKSATQPEALALDAAFVRYPDCTGPATSLDPALAAPRPRTGPIQPDNTWAALAEETPGGFAGVLYDDGKPVLMLTDPSLAARAKYTLAPLIPTFPIQTAEVRKARWNFAQLVDWFNHMNPTVWRTPGVRSADKDESINRISYGVADSAAITRLIEALGTLPLPCDLVAIEIVPPVELR